jgi:hypothetical protein
MAYQAAESRIETLEYAPKRTGLAGKPSRSQAVGRIPEDFKSRINGSIRHDRPSRRASALFGTTRAKLWQGYTVPTKGVQHG